MMSPITEKVLTFQQEPHNQKLKEELLSYCQLVIYTYPATIKVINTEDAAELLLYVNPRLETLLLNYSYTGIPFENYIKKVSYLQAHSFLKIKRHEHRRYLCESVSDEDMEYFLYSRSSLPIDYSHGDWASNEEFLWSENTPLSQRVKEKMKNSSSFKRRILHLVLLCSDLLNSTQISFLSDFLEIEEKELAQMISEALSLSEKRIALKEKSKNIRDNHYFEKEFLERERRFLVSVDAHPYYISKVENKAAKEKRYFNQINSTLKRRPTTVTHATAGKITGVPKGTVDSGLQSLYLYLHKYMDDTIQME